jgi:hypothetical protein
LKKLSLGLLFLAAGCGPSPVLYVRVEAPLLVPEACDALQMQIRRENNTSFEKKFDLAALKVQFPLGLLLDADAMAKLDGQFRISVSALKNGSLAKPWATREAVATLDRRKLTSVTVELCDCPQ